MTKGIEEGAKASDGNPLKPLDELNKKPEGNTKEANPFELVGRLFGSLAAASARTEQQQETAKNADTTSTEQNGASNDDNDKSNERPITIQCTQQ